MIPRAPHICLSCRRALAKRLSLNTIRCAPYSTSKLLKTHQKDRFRGDKSWLHREMIALERAGEKKRLKKSLVPSSELSADDRARIFGQAGHKKSEEYEDLSMPRLGEDGKVLVLRDSVITQYYEHSKRGIPRKKAEHIDILGQIDEERGLLAPEEVRLNIDMLRPAPGQQIYAWEEVSDLVGKMQKGFTIPQLEGYIKHHAELRNDSESAPALIPSAPIPKAHPGISFVTPWRPGVSKIQEYFDNDPLRGYVLDSYTRKQRTILRLLIECWQIEALEIIDGVGQFEITIKNKIDLDLFLVGPYSALDKLCTDRLAFDNEKLEVFRSRNVVRVTTTSTKRDWILEGFHELFDNVVRDRINVSKFAPRGEKKDVGTANSWIERTYDKRTMEELANLVQLQVRKMNDRGTFEISGVKRGEDDTRWHPVRRLLMMSNSIKDRSRHQIATDVDTGGLFIPYIQLGGLNWWARLRSWTRWTVPVKKDPAKFVQGSTPVHTLEEKYRPFGRSIYKVTTNSEQAAPALQPQAYPSKLDSLDAIKMTTLNDTDQDKPRQIQSFGGWANRHFTKTTATFGAILHGNYPTNSGGEFDLRGGRDASLPLNEFSTQVPNLSRFIATTSPASRNILSTLVLRFRADPFTKGPKRKIGGEAFIAFPEIEMHFSVGNNKKTLKAVYAIVDKHTTDVMLPQEVADVRFTQETTSRWRKGLSEFRQYIQKCDLDNDQMEVYPSTTFPITEDLCRGKGLNLLQASTPTDKNPQSPNNSGSGKTLDVPYLFAGLEFRKQVVMKFQDWNILYTNIEGGKSGGKRGELKLRPLVNGKIPSEKEFIRMAYKIVGLLGGKKSDDVEERVVRMVRGKEIEAKARIVKTDKGEVIMPTGFTYFAKRLALDNLEDEQDGDETLEDVEVFEDTEAASADSGERLAEHEASGVVDNGNDIPFDSDRSENELEESSRREDGEFKKEDVDEDLSREEGKS